MELGAVQPRAGRLELHLLRGGAAPPRLPSATVETQLQLRAAVPAAACRRLRRASGGILRRLLRRLVQPVL